MSVNAAEAAASFSFISPSANWTNWQFEVEVSYLSCASFSNLPRHISTSFIQSVQDARYATVTLPDSVTQHLPTPHDNKHV